MKIDEINKQIKLTIRGRSSEKTPAAEWIEGIYNELPRNPLNHDQVAMVFGEGEDQQIALFELEPSSLDPKTVYIKWFQAYPQRQGVGRRALGRLQDMAGEAGLKLNLTSWKHGRVPERALTRFYKSMGFKPGKRGVGGLVWEPGSIGEGEVIQFRRPGLKPDAQNLQLAKQLASELFWMQVSSHYTPEEEAAEREMEDSLARIGYSAEWDLDDPEFNMVITHVASGRQYRMGEEELTTQSVDEAWSNSYKKSINCSNPRGFSQRAHCAARRKRSRGGKTKSKPIRESLDMKTAARALEDYANKNISPEQDAFGDFMYHAELLKQGHPDVHRKDLAKLPKDTADRISEIVSRQAVTEARKKRAKTLIDGMIKTLVSRGRTHDEAVADLKKQIDARFYEHVEMLAEAYRNSDSQPGMEFNQEEIRWIGNLKKWHSILVSKHLFDQINSIYEPNRRGNITKVFDFVDTAFVGNKHQIRRFPDGQNFVIKSNKLGGVAVVADRDDDGNRYYMLKTYHPTLKIAKGEPIFHVNESEMSEVTALGKETPTVSELATKYDVSPQDVLRELAKGVEIEQEHTDLLHVAREIALDHLGEDLYYYVKLARAEKDSGSQATAPSQKVGEAMVPKKLPKTEAGWLTAVSRRPDLIRFNPSPSEAVQIAALKKEPDAIGDIENPSEDMQLFAVRQNGDALRSIKDPSKAVQMAAVNQNGYSISYVKDPSEEMKIAAVKRYGLAIGHIRNPSKAVQAAAIGSDAFSLAYISNLDRDLLNDPEIKKAIMTRMLRLFNTRIDMAKEMFRHLKRAGCDWPELEVVERSINADDAARKR